MEMGYHQRHVLWGNALDIDTQAIAVDIVLLLDRLKVSEELCESRCSVSCGLVATAVALPSMTS